MSPEVVLAITLGWVLASAVGLGYGLPALRRARGDLAAVPAAQVLGRRQARRNLRAVGYRAAGTATSLLVGVLALLGRAGYVPTSVSALVATVLLCSLPVLLLLDGIDHERHQDALEAALPTATDATPVVLVVPPARDPHARTRASDASPAVDPSSHHA